MLSYFTEKVNTLICLSAGWKVRGSLESLGLFRWTPVINTPLHLKHWSNVIQFLSLRRALLQQNAVTMQWGGSHKSINQLCAHAKHLKIPGASPNIHNLCSSWRSGVVGLSVTQCSERQKKTWVCTLNTKFSNDPGTDELNIGRYTWQTPLLLI